METIVLVIHLMIAIALILVVLLQRSEGGALGMGGGGGLTTARGAANLLTRITAILATCFIITSLTLAILAGNTSRSESILDRATVEESTGVEGSAEDAGDVTEDAESTDDLPVVEEGEPTIPEVPIAQ